MPILRWRARATRRSSERAFGLTLKAAARSDTAVGAIILSEAFVGHRLANLSDFAPFEYGRLVKYSRTLVEIAEQFVSKLDAQGPPASVGGTFVPGEVMTTAILGFLLIHLPIIVVESITQRPVVTAGLSATSKHRTVNGTGLALLRAVQDVLGLVAPASQRSRGCGRRPDQRSEHDERRSDVHGLP